MYVLLSLFYFRYQLADWRVRPLPDDMLHYARADTHFLLAAADALRAELCTAGGRLPEGWAVNVPRHSGAAQVGGAGVVSSAHTASRASRCVHATCNGMTAQMCCRTCCQNPPALVFACLCAKHTPADSVPPDTALTRMYSVTCRLRQLSVDRLLLC
jgi:hypothetical protein